MMPSCSWGNCKKVSENHIHIVIPNSSDDWWKTGENIYLCKKHYAKILKKLNIMEDENDES